MAQRKGKDEKSKNQKQGAEALIKQSHRKNPIRFQIEHRLHQCGQ